MRQPHIMPFDRYSESVNQKPELEDCFMQHKIAKKYPDLFRDLTLEDYDKLSKKWWISQGEGTKKLGYEETFLQQEYNPKTLTQRDIRFMYKSHIGKTMSEEDYPPRR